LAGAAAKEAGATAENAIINDNAKGITRFMNVLSSSQNTVDSSIQSGS
jgi:hypothetical protein